MKAYLKAAMKAVSMVEWMAVMTVASTVDQKVAPMAGHWAVTKAALLDVTMVGMMVGMKVD